MVCLVIQNFIPLSHKRHDLNIKSVFCFSPQLLLETFPILRIIQRDRSEIYIGLNAKYRYSWQILVKLEFSRQIIEKNQVSNFMKNRPVTAMVLHFDRRADEETNKTKADIPFSQFCGCA